MTTKSEIENYILMNIDSSFDSQIDLWIESVQKEIEEMTNRKFTVDDEFVERKFDGNGRCRLLIGDYSEIESVTIDGVEIEDYYEYPANSDVKFLLDIDSVFPRGKQNIVISAKWGREAPRDLIWASTVLVAGIVQNAQKVGGEVSREKIGTYEIAYTNRQYADYDRAMNIVNSYKFYSI